VNTCYPITYLALALLLLSGGPALSPGLAGPVDQAEVCLMCHEDIAGLLDSPVVHPPAAESECTACHNPHVARFSGLLKQSPGPLCAACHPEIAGELERPVTHQPAREGKCVACHLPHGGEHQALLLKPGRELCVECHQDVTGWSKKPVQHKPFAEGRCFDCHEPHGAEGEGLLTSPGGDICLTCHPANSRFKAAHKGYPVELAACQQCHDPHASERPGLFRQKLHSPFEDGDCAVCHSGPDAGRPFATLLPEDQLCGACHEEEVSASIHLPFPHVAPGGTGCTACHNPHTADGTGLLQDDQQGLCLTCHDPGGSSSGEAGRFTTHGDGLDCTTCHSPHGGERPLLLVDDPVLLCADCHEHQHGITHPLGEGTRDPRNGTPMDCLSCHGMHDSPHPFYLHRSGDRDLCVSCHKDLAGGRK